MTAPVGGKRFLGPVPSRSFTKPVAHAGEGYDDADTLYQGIFGRGF